MSASFLAPPAAAAPTAAPGAANGAAAKPDHAKGPPFGDVLGRAVTAGSAASEREKAAPGEEAKAPAGEKAKVPTPTATPTATAATPTRAPATPALEGRAAEVAAAQSAVARAVVRVATTTITVLSEPLVDTVPLDLPTSEAESLATEPTEMQGEQDAQAALLAGSALVSAPLPTAPTAGASAAAAAAGTEADTGAATSIAAPAVVAAPVAAVPPEVPDDGAGTASAPNGHAAEQAKQQVQEHARTTTPGPTDWMPSTSGNAPAAEQAVAASLPAQAADQAGAVHGAILGGTSPSSLAPGRSAAAVEAAAEVAPITGGLADAVTTMAASAAVTAAASSAPGRPTDASTDVAVGEASLAAPAVTSPAAAPAPVDVAPLATPAEVRGQAVVARIAEIARTLENAPPPRSILVEMTELPGLRIEIRLAADGGVHVRAQGPTDAVAPLAHLGRDLADALGQRGLSLGDFSARDDADARSAAADDRDERPARDGSPSSDQPGRSATPATSRRPADAGAVRL